MYISIYISEKKFFRNAGIEAFLQISRVGRIVEFKCEFRCLGHSVYAEKTTGAGQLQVSRTRRMNGRAREAPNYLKLLRGICLLTRNGKF